MPKLKLLLVEDREMSKDMLERALEEWGVFEVEAVDSREAALGAVRQQAYDFILLDLSIWDYVPDPDGRRKASDHTDPHHGIAVLEEILQEYSDRMLIFSAHVDTVGGELARIGVLESLTLPRPQPWEVIKDRISQRLHLG